MHYAKDKSVHTHSQTACIHPHSETHCDISFVNRMNPKLFYLDGPEQTLTKKSIASSSSDWT